MDPRFRIRIRIRTKISWIRNSVRYIPTASHSAAASAARILWRRPPSSSMWRLAVVLVTWSPAAAGMKNAAEWSFLSNEYPVHSQSTYISSTTVYIPYVPLSELGLPHPFPAIECAPGPSPRNQRGGGTLACGWGVGESQFRRLVKKLITLPTLWVQ